MNVEGFFVRTNSFDALHDVVLQRLNSADDPIGMQPDWGLESSYDAILARNPKRKIALSKPQLGWIAGLESKEFIDFALMQLIGESLKTDVIVYQLSEITGGCGYTVFSNGHVATTHFDDDATDPLDQTRALIRDMGIPFDITTFREAARDDSGNWQVIQRSMENKP